MVLLVLGAILILFVMLKIITEAVGIAFMVIVVFGYLACGAYLLRKELYEIRQEENWLFYVLWLILWPSFYDRNEQKQQI